MSGGTSTSNPYYQAHPPKKKKVRYGKQRDWKKEPKKPTELPPFQYSGPTKTIPMPPLRNFKGGRNSSKVLWYACDNCGSLYPVRVERKPRHAHSFCKPECRNKWHSRNLTGRKLSEETKQKISDTKTGVNREDQIRRKEEIARKREKAGPRNPEWYNEAKDLAEAFRRTGEWKRKSKEILKRDKYTCQACGWTRDEVEQMDVHHVKKLAEWIYEGNDPGDYPDELLTALCSQCHTHTEGQKDEYKWPKSYKGEETRSGYPRRVPID